ncbi:Di-copper centre-containing protein [Apiospora hydei]|uniref:Di-copper centre-containing protein n=1 Tax=Apiospora hydei TaxID=1337664 RepID=A0ABR1VKF8_9PEZI
MLLADWASFVGGCVALVMPAVVAAAPAKPQCSSTPPLGGGIPMPADFQVLQDRYHEQIIGSLGAQGCTKDSIAKRRSWDDLEDETRKDYIRAVHCLANKPALTDRSLAPGAVNRLDDFTYIHINQTNIIHQSGYLLPWHRLFLWQLEEALRNECGYKDYLPYWDNARFSADQTKSRVWDGNPATSFGGNGAPRTPPEGAALLLIPGLVIDFWLLMPLGTGGGCVTTGPFANLTLTLGPVAKPLRDPVNKYGYLPTPRCLARSFDPSYTGGASLTWGNATAIVSAGDIGEFREGIERLWHRQSHTFIGGDGADPFSPTNDPVFYLLHAQIDRLWAIWQGQDLQARTYTIAGNRTFFGIPLDYAPDVPPSLAANEDPMEMGLGFRPLTREGMPTTELGRCYIYV